MQTPRPCATRRIVLTDVSIEEALRALNDLCNFADEAVAAMEQRQDMIRGLPTGGADGRHHQDHHARAAHRAARARAVPHNQADAEMEVPLGRRHGADAPAEGRRGFLCLGRSVRQFRQEAARPVPAFRRGDRELRERKRRSPDIAEGPRRFPAARHPNRHRHGRQLVHEPKSWSGKLGPAYDGVGWNDRRKTYDVLDAKLERAVLDAFSDGRFDVVDSKVMLSAHCLICGKTLTDPASMARYIGPECAGTSSVHVPRMRNLAKVEKWSDPAAPVYEPAPVPRRERKLEPVADLFAHGGARGTAGARAEEQHPRNHWQWRRCQRRSRRNHQTMGEQIKAQGRCTVMLGLALAMAEGPEDDEELEEMLGYVRELYAAREERELEEALA